MVVERRKRKSNGGSMSVALLEAPSVTFTWDMIRGGILVCFRDNGVKAAITKSALKYVDILEKREIEPFTNVYALQDGKLVLEWEIEGDVFYRITVEGEGKGNLTVSRQGEITESCSVKW